MLRFIRDNPVAVLGAGFLALVIWVAADLATAPGPKLQTSESLAPAGELPLPGAPTDVVVTDGRQNERRTLSVRTTVPTEVLPHVKPGMNRHEVEGFLGRPDPDQIQPITSTNGRMTYSMAYEFDDLGPLMTIRPIQPRPRMHVEPSPGGRLTIAFVFDAARPGHPLIDIIYPDPLF
jgi:hypothetical protein